jgi:hypothetical protein
MPGGSRRLSNTEVGGGGVPWYSRSRGEQPVVGTPAGRETGGYPPPISGGGGDWWYNGYWGGGSGSLYYPTWYRYYGSCHPWYGYGGFGLGYFYYDPSWWSYGGYYGCWGGYGPYSGYAGWGGFGYGGYGGFSGGGGGGYSRPVGEAGLKLKVKPSDAQVFVDGYFAGEVDQFNGPFQRLPLSAGQHKIEIRAPGYEPLIVDINIEAFQTTTYTGELKKRG